MQAVAGICNPEKQELPAKDENNGATPARNGLSGAMGSIQYVDKKASHGPYGFYRRERYPKPYITEPLPPGTDFREPREASIRR